MSLKIFHTGDLHIGLRFANYPDDIREQLVDTRIQTLQRMVHMANTQQCDLFVIAGDLFDHLRVPAKTINRVIQILEEFSGSAVLVLPGNHDFDDGMQEIWNIFNRKNSSKIRVLNQNRPIDLNVYGHDITIYSAPCDRKHSDTHNLAWIQNLDHRPDTAYHIGIAHGALQSLSPDLENKYFNMSLNELEGLNLDLWLLGHTHIPYPAQVSAQGTRIFNSGTPEPDGMDCRHEGFAWIIELDDDKKVRAQRVVTGEYRFRDEEFTVSNEDDLNRLVEYCLRVNPEKTLFRLNLTGSMDPDLYSRKEEWAARIKKAAAYCIIDDTNLKQRITPERIREEFTEGSFPQQLLDKLLVQGDEDALQMAYELIEGVIR